jgi:hypothetical protein
MRELLLVLALLCGSVSGALAQQASPIEDLMSRARTALDDLNYARADSVARRLLKLGDQLDYDQRVAAHQLLVSALYPEESVAQQLDSARHYLRELVTLAPNGMVPRAISWPGLDALLEDVRETTFAVRVEPLGDTLLVTYDGVAAFSVAATRTTLFSLVAEPLGGGTRVVLDSVGPSETGTLRIAVLDGDDLRVNSGDFVIHVVSADANPGAELIESFAARFVVPPLELVPIPSTLDSSTLLPEETVPRKGRNMLIGVGLGVTTALFTTAFRADGTVGSTAPDRRGYVVGGAIALGAVVGALLEKSRPLPENIVHNAQMHTNFAESVRSAEERNVGRRAMYRATVVLHGRRD